MKILSLKRWVIHFSCLAATVICLSWLAPSLGTQQAKPIASTFDRGPDGWRASSFPDYGPYDQVLGPTTPEWSATGGHPGGAIFMVDPLPNSNFCFDAPAAYLGDKHQYYGGQLRYELKSEGGAESFDEVDVILLSPGLVLVHDTPGKPASAWLSFSIPLTETEWKVGKLAGRPVTKAEFERALAHVMALRIRGEFQNGRDTGWLDNVVLLPAAGSTTTTIGQTATGQATATQKPAPDNSASTVIIDQNVARGGGHLEYRDPGHPLNGFSLDIPEGAYDSTRRFTVASRPAPIEAATLLIRVENGGGYANTPITMRIPARIRADEFAMAFFYDEKTGELEGLPLLNQDAEGVTVATAHFSSFLVKVIPKALLPNKVDAKYLPGLDDWQMINYGSAISPGGHCAGQSLSSMWYYCEKRLKGGPPLYGLYDDNYPGFRTHPTAKTNNFWEDDSLALRLVSTIQQDGVWDSQWRLKSQELSREGRDDITFNAFRFSMNLLREPQYVEVWGWDKRGSAYQKDWIWTGHALVVYKIEDSRLYVADPNYPGGKDSRGRIVDRFIQYDEKTGKFEPFMSGANAANLGISYFRIFYVAKTAIVRWDRFGERWNEFVRSFAVLPSENAKLIGHDRFPEYELLLSTSGFAPGTATPIVDQMVVDKDRIEVRIQCGRYKWPLPPQNPPDCATSPLRVIVFQDGRRMLLAPGETITLTAGRNTLGFLVEARTGHDWTWVDRVGWEPGTFKWVDYKEYNIFLGEEANILPYVSAEIAGPPGGTLGAGESFQFKVLRYYVKKLGGGMLNILKTLPIGGDEDAFIRSNAAKNKWDLSIEWGVEGGGSIDTAGVFTAPPKPSVSTIVGTIRANRISSRVQVTVSER